MATNAIATRIGDLEVLIETTTLAGTEPTSAASGVADRAVDAFERSRRAIVEIAAATSDLIGAAAARGARPDHLEVEFGIKISTKGNVIVAGASGEATLRVKLTYDRPPP